MIPTIDESYYNTVSFFWNVCIIKFMKVTVNCAWIILFYLFVCFLFCALCVLYFVFALCVLCVCVYVCVCVCMSSVCVCLCARA